VCRPTDSLNNKNKSGKYTPIAVIGIANNIAIKKFQGRPTKNKITSDIHHIFPVPFPWIIGQLIAASGKLKMCHIIIYT